MFRTKNNKNCQGKGSNCLSSSIPVFTGMLAFIINFLDSHVKKEAKFFVGKTLQTQILKIIHDVNKLLFLTPYLSIPHSLNFLGTKH